MFCTDVIKCSMITTRTDTTQRKTEYDTYVCMYVCTYVHVVNMYVFITMLNLFHTILKCSIAFNYCYFRYHYHTLQQYIPLLQF